ncbi:serine hydrolase [Ramlibacter sp. G-1-2-2]|uniref:Serine hydrolase n=1 Tax=Ramlibacter agri TaxID=2728837 RepID=A0A848H9S6_9BURK|nr:serine hydrolase [Ramlibacter agri]NML44378.1 serine hydrolase [Ramlibacter agri]
MNAASYDDGLTRAEPASRGGIADFLGDARRLGVELHGFMAWQGSAVVAEGWWHPYGPQRPHMMHSATKSFLSAAVGLAVHERRFALEDRVVSFFPAHLPHGIGENLALMTVEDLLTQTSGHAQGASGSVWRGIRSSWIAEFFKIPVVHAPGSFFRYTSATSFLLSAILTRTTGMTAHDYLRPRLLEPLGIHDLAWDVGPENINPGGNGISCKLAGLLKLAVLHLQGGAWNGAQLLPRDWVRRATTPQRGNAHGYHWWMGPRGSFYAYGVFGQFAIAFPEQDAVVAVNAATPPGEETLRSLLWSHFPAALQAGEELSTLTLLPDLPAGSSPLAQSRRFEAEPNEDGIRSLHLRFEPGRCVLEVSDARGDHAITMGLGEWIEGDTTMSGAPLHHGYEPASMRVLARAGWRDERTLEMQWQFVETAFRDTVVLHFESPQEVRMERSVNVNSGSLRRPTVRGIAPR